MERRGWRWNSLHGIPNPAQLDIPYSILCLKSSYLECIKGMLKRFEHVLAFGKRLSLVNDSSGCGLNPRGGRNFAPVENIKISSNEIDESPATTQNRTSHCKHCEKHCRMRLEEHLSVTQTYADIF